MSFRLLVFFFLFRSSCDISGLSIMCKACSIDKYLKIVCNTIQKVDGKNLTKGRGDLIFPIGSIVHLGFTRIIALCNKINHIYKNKKNYDTLSFYLRPVSRLHLEALILKQKLVACSTNYELFYKALRKT